MLSVPVRLDEVRDVPTLLLRLLALVRDSLVELEDLIQLGRHG